MTHECSMTILSVIFALGNTRVYVGAMNSSDVTANVKVSIDK